MLFYTATDKEIYDLLISQRQQFTTNVLLELARSRNTFYSRHDSRDSLVEELSLLTYGYNQLAQLQKFNDMGRRVEQTTTIRLKGKFEDTDIRALVDAYRDEAPSDMKVVTGRPSKGHVTVDLKYTETDFSRTRLRQRRAREASIDIDVEDDGLVITLPANATAIEVASKLKQKFDQKSEAFLPVEKVDFSILTDAISRTRFFTELIGTLPGLDLDNVTSVRVKASQSQGSTDLDNNDSEEDGGSDGTSAEASDEFRALVRDVALQGSSVLMSSQYKDLQDGGFYITSIRWRAKETSSPYHLFEFTAGVDEPELGQGFKFTVWKTLVKRGGSYVKTWRQLEDDQRKAILKTLDITAIETFRKIVSERSEGAKK